jgi:hypothetical protein
MSRERVFSTCADIGVVRTGFFSKSLTLSTGSIAVIPIRWVNLIISPYRAHHQPIKIRLYYILVLAYNLFSESISIQEVVKTDSSEITA